MCLLLQGKQGNTVILKGFLRDFCGTASRNETQCTSYPPTRQLEKLEMRGTHRPALPAQPAFLCGSCHFPEVGRALSRAEQTAWEIQGRHLAPKVRQPQSGIEDHWHMLNEKQNSPNQERRLMPKVSGRHVCLCKGGSSPFWVGSAVAFQSCFAGSEELISPRPVGGLGSHSQRQK